MSFAQKKKLMMMRQAAPAPIPSGYITDGLLLFLDGLQVASDSLWVDLVSGVEYTLHNAVKTAGGGVTFAGDSSSYGESTATFPTGVTIEAAYSLDDTSVDAGIFVQSWPDRDNDNPVVCLIRSKTYGAIFAKFGSRSQSIRRASIDPIEIISAIRLVTGSRAVKNGDVVTDTFNSYASYPSGGITGSLIGTRGTSAWMNGTLHSLRIYNRELTDEEIIANQAIDDIRYNLGVIS